MFSERVFLFSFFLPCHKIDFWGILFIEHFIPRRKDLSLGFWAGAGQKPRERPWERGCFACVTVLCDVLLACFSCALQKPLTRTSHILRQTLTLNPWVIYAKISCSSLAIWLHSRGQLLHSLTSSPTRIQAIVGVFPGVCWCKFCSLQVQVLFMITSVMCSSCLNC